MVNQTHYAGETIRLTIEYRDTETKSLTNPSSVSLVGLTQGSVTPYPLSLPTIVNFTQIQVGTWRLSLNTAGFTSDRYDWTVQATTVSSEIVLVKDYFILTDV